MNNEQRFAEMLLNIGAVSLNPQKPFTWTSGLRSPIYCDNRLIISYPEYRTQIMEGLVEIVKEHFNDVDVIAGTATAGIPHAAIIAHLLNKPMIYVRSNAKEHGKQNAIEGVLKPGQTVLMVEDLISTGKSVINAAKYVQAQEAKVIGCLAIFNYLLPSGIEAFNNVEYPLITLTNYRALISQAVLIPELAPFKTTLEEWYQDPVSWSNKFGAQVCESV